MNRTNSRAPAPAGLPSSSLFYFKFSSLAQSCLSLCDPMFYSSKSKCVYLWSQLSTPFSPWNPKFLNRKASYDDEIQELWWLDERSLYCIDFQRRKLRPKEFVTWSTLPDLVHMMAHVENAVCGAVVNRRGCAQLKMTVPESLSTQTPKCCPRSVRVACFCPTGWEGLLSESGLSLVFFSTVCIVQIWLLYLRKALGNIWKTKF